MSTRLKRSYQFAGAVKTLQSGNLFAWVVKTQLSSSYYGVVRYFLNGDTRCWIESTSSFEEIADAEKWIHNQFENLRSESE